MQEPGRISLLCLHAIATGLIVFTMFAVQLEENAQHCLVLHCITSHHTALQFVTLLG